MKVVWLNVFLVAWAVTTVLGGQSPALRITSPEPGAIVTGRTRLEAVIAPPADVKAVNFFVNGRLVCTVERPPFVCPWDPGPVVRGHHVRVVATMADGSLLTGNVRTKDLGHVERARAEAVLVPVLVTRGGDFVHGLKKEDFDVFENGVQQRVASLLSEESPLDLVLAIDISGSMADSLEDVKTAVKLFLSKLRPGDAATLLGFNDTPFIVAEREKDQRTREEAVGLLSSWGGTALYDATVLSVDMVSRESGRKGIVLFSDGDDRSSLTARGTATARVQASDAMLYAVAFGAGATLSDLRSNLENYARSTGGSVFFPRQTKDLDGVFDRIVTELGNQYVLSYSSTDPRQDGKWREIKVRARKGDYDIRARRGYRADGLQRSEK